MRIVHLTIAMLVAVIAFAVPAQAVVKPKLPISQEFRKIDNVIIGKITGIDAERRLVSADVTEVLKGKAAAQQMRVQIVQPADLLKAVVVGEPVVVFARNNGAASIHLADTWFASQPLANVPMAWRTVQEGTVMRLGFPGRTSALVRVVHDLAAGRFALLEEVADPFAGEIKAIAKLNISKPTFLLAGDFTGDGKTDLLAGSPDGAKLFVNGGSGFEDATEAWGLKGAGGSRACYDSAIGCLLLGAKVLTNDGKKFSPAGEVDLPADLLAVAIVRSPADSKPQVLAVTTAGQVLTFESPAAGQTQWTKKTGPALWKNDAATPPIAAAIGNFAEDGSAAIVVLREAEITRYALDGKTPPADFTRLTGDRLGVYDKEGRGFKGSAVLAMDVNGDGNLDFVIVHEGGGMVLINRGYGAFFVSVAGAKAISPSAGKKPPFTLTSGAPCAGAKLRPEGPPDLLVLSADGQLYDVPSRAPAEPATP